MTIEFTVLKEEYTANGKILTNVEFEVIYNGAIYYVEAFPLDYEQSDTYAIHVYKTDSRTLSDETEVANAWIDSTGGSFKGESINISDEEYNELTELNEFITDKLFGKDKDGFIKEF